MTAKKTTRRKRFNRITCPVRGCKHMRGKPQEGTVPGVKRHVIAIHGRDVYEKVKWAKYPLHQAPSGNKIADVLLANGKAKTKAKTAAPRRAKVKAKV